jgi:hypothetical protein
MRMRFEVIPYAAELPAFFGSRAPVNFFGLSSIFILIVCYIYQVRLVFFCLGLGRLIWGQRHCYRQQKRR